MKSGPTQEDLYSRANELLNCDLSDNLILQQLLEILYAAVGLQDHIFVKKLLSVQEIYHGMSQDHGSSLYLAVENNDYAMVKLLLEVPSVQTQLAVDEYSSLHLACEEGFNEIALLLSQNQKVRELMHQDGSCLRLACENEDLTLVRSMTHNQAILIQFVQFHYPELSKKLCAETESDLYGMLVLGKYLMLCNDAVTYIGGYLPSQALATSKDRITCIKRLTDPLFVENREFKSLDDDKENQMVNDSLDYQAIDDDVKPSSQKKRKIEPTNLDR